MDTPRDGAGKGGRDTLDKVAGKIGEVAAQAAATAMLWRQLDLAQRSLARERAEALRLRAQIGEEMYKLWRARALPPSTLDELFAAIDRTMSEIEVQRQRVDALRAQFTGGSTAPPPDPVLILGADPEHLGVTFQAQPPPVPAAPTRRLAPVDEPADVGVAAGPSPTAHPGGSAGLVCPTCGAAGPAGKPFCGYCGARLA